VEAVVEAAFGDQQASLPRCRHGLWLARQEQGGVHRLVHRVLKSLRVGTDLNGRARAD
jgi:hypothetical protein